MFKFFFNSKLARKSKSAFLGSVVSLLSALPLVATISSGDAKSSQNRVSPNSFGQKNLALLSETSAILELFLLEIRSFYTKGNGPVRQIERLKSLVSQKQRIYNGSTYSEVMIYLFGFKWLWGIFTGYSSTYIGPAYAELMAAKEALQANQDFVASLKNKLFEKAEKAKASVQKILLLEGRSVNLNLALQKIRTKLNLLDTEYTYLVERLADEERNQLGFENALASGRKSQYQEHTYRTTIDSSADKVSGSYSSEFTSGLDQGTRQIWEKAEADRFQERRHELREETQRARSNFENVDAVNKLIDIIHEEVSR